VENVDRNLEEQIRNLCDRTSDSLDRRILHDLAGKLKECETLKPTATSAGIWRMTMISKRIRLAAAAIVALAVLLPVSYGTIQAVKKHFIVSEDKVTFEYPDPNGNVTSYVYGRSVCVGDTDAVNEEQARARFESSLASGRRRSPMERSSPLPGGIPRGPEWKRNSRKKRKPG
jgi:hypothetical protein